MSVWICSLLFILNALSFIPHIRQLYRLKNNAKIPIILLFFGIVSAMQQLILCYKFSLSRAKYSLTAQKPSEWMHLFYATGAWLLASSILFLADICYSSMPLIKKVTGICLFLVCEYVTLANGRDGRSAEMSLIGFFNLLLRINPAIICVTVYVFNDSVNQQRPDYTSLVSITGLVSQMLIHIILPISWLGLVGITFETFWSLRLKGLMLAYHLFGWALVDNALFAALQGWLLWVALKERKAKTTHERAKSLLGP